MFRGAELSADDLLRRDVITDLMCHSRVDYAAIEARHRIPFRETFAEALDRLRPMEDDGLVHLQEDRLEVLPRGRLLLRNVAMVFDAYLQADSGQRYSKVV